MTQHPLSRLLARLLARLDRSQDAALRLGTDPRKARPGSLIAAGWTCPAPMLGCEGPCGRSKTPTQDTCGRAPCVRWFEAQQEREREPMPAVWRRAG